MPVDSRPKVRLQLLPGKRGLETPPSDRRSKLGRIVRRLAGVAALGWIAYMGALIRDCPTSGVVCHADHVLVGAIVIPVAIMLVGQAIGWLADRMRSVAAARESTSASGLRPHSQAGGFLRSVHARS